MLLLESRLHNITGNIMALAHPALNTTGKRRGKNKFASAEAARRHRELEAEWSKRQAEWASLSTIKSSNSSKNTSVVSPIAKSPIRSTEQPASLNSWVTGAVASKPSQHYSGDKMLGITVLHKSCLQPVFNAEAAVDAAKMRR